MPMDIDTVESIPIVIDSKSNRHSIVTETVKFLRRHLDNPIFVISDKTIAAPVDNAEWVRRRKDYFPLRNISAFANRREFSIVMPWPDDNFLESIDLEMLTMFFDRFYQHPRTGFFKLHQSPRDKGRIYEDNIFFSSKKSKWYIDTYPFWVKLDYLKFIASVKIKDPWEMERQAVQRARLSPMKVMGTRKECYKIHNFIKRGYVSTDAYEFAREEGLDFSDMDLRLYDRVNKYIYGKIRAREYKPVGPKLRKQYRRSMRRGNFSAAETYDRAFDMWQRGKYKAIAALVHETHTKCEWAKEDA